MNLVRTTAFHVSALILGPLWFTVLVTGWATGLGLLVTLLGLPVIVLTLMAAREGIAAEVLLARRLLAADVAAPARLPGWSLRGRLADPAIWRGQAYLLARFAGGLAIGTTLLSVWATAVGLLVAPLWYWTLPEGIELGLFQVDRLWIAFAIMPLGIVVGIVGALLTRLSETGWRRLAEWLLPGSIERDPGQPLPSVAPALRTTLAVTAALEGLCVLLWALTGRTSAWPAWTALGLFIPAGVHAAVLYAPRFAPSPRWRGWTRQAGVSLVAWIVCLGAWAVPGTGYFWPVWPLLGMAIGLGVKALLTYGAESEAAVLTPRMDELTRTRAGAVGARDDELARIERDLHDGAQARLVAVAMNLGLAEDRLTRDPDGARELVLEAQQQARSAIKELRDLARGIAPPVLADRGLQAAVEALAVTTPLDVSVTGSTGPRPDAAIERAAYFVAAEALANAAKHAGATRIAITLQRTADRLTVEVADDGRGGANPAGSGIAGLRARVEAVDGHLDVESPSGEGTIIRRIASMRVVIAEDLVLLRDGLARLLHGHEFDVVAQCEDADGPAASDRAHKPDLAIVDVRLPPDYRDEGLRAALEARRRRPHLTVLMPRQYVESGVRRRAAGRRPRRRRLPAEGAGL